MTRRSFLRRIGAAAAAVALTLARHLPGIAPKLVGLPVPAVEDKNLGISMRYVKAFDITADVYRHDLVFDMRPDFAVRVQG